MLILAVLLIFYIMARTAERPPELSIARSDQGNSSNPQPASSSSAPISVFPFLLVGAGLLVTIGILVAVNSKTKKPEMTPMPRRAPAFNPTPVPGPRRPEPVAAKAPTTNGDTLECPQCAELIKRKALVCRFCGFKLDSFVDRTKTFTSEDPGRTEAAD